MIKHTKVEVKKEQSVLQPLVDFLNESSMIEDYKDELSYEERNELEDAIIALEEINDVITK